MPEVQFVNQGDKRILLIDIVSIHDCRAVPSLVEKATRLAQTAEGPGSLRMLIDLTGTRINKQVISSLNNISRTNGRYAKATAFVGLNKAWTLILSTLLRTRGKTNHKVIGNRTEALVWLEQQ